MSIWLIRSRRSCVNLLKTLVCNSPTSNVCNEHSVSCNPSASLFMASRYKSTKTEKELFSSEQNHVHGLDYPGGMIAFTSEISFLPGSSEERVKCYRLLDQDGYPVSSNMPEHVGKELALKIYVNMVTLQTMDTLFYEAQRQGRFSFYLSSFGEEAINIASAASLSPDDHILAQAELDRFCDALISIREEIAEIEQGKANIKNNVVKGAPHPLQVLMVDKWTKPYSREYAAFPASWLRSAKFWPTTCRIDNVYGDRNLVCTLQSPHEEEEKAAATA